MFGAGLGQTFYLETFHRQQVVAISFLFGTTNILIHSPSTYFFECVVKKHKAETHFEREL